MKIKLFFLIIVLLSTISLTAQASNVDTTSTNNINIRAEVGYSQQFRYGNYTVTSPFHVLRGGMNVVFPIRQYFGIETGLRYAYAFGGRTQQYLHSGKAAIDYTAHWLDVPVRCTYSIPIFWDMKLFLYAGPTFSVGLSHTEKIDFTQTKVEPAPTTDLNYPVSGTYDMYKNELNRFSIQLGAGGGLQWKNYRLKSGYDWGLNNISKNKNYPERMKGWYVAFEYEF